MDKKSWEVWFLSFFVLFLYRKIEGFSCDQNLEEIVFADITLLRYFVRNDVQPVIARRSRSDPDRIQTSLIEANAL